MVRKLVSPVKSAAPGPLFTPTIMTILTRKISCTFPAWTIAGCMMVNITPYLLLKVYRYTFRKRFSGIYSFPPFSIGINSLSSGRKIIHLIIGSILDKFHYSKTHTNTHTHTHTHTRKSQKLFPSIKNNNNNKITLKHRGIQMHLCSKPLARNEAVCEVLRHIDRFIDSLLLAKEVIGQ